MIRYVSYERTKREERDNSQKTMLILDPFLWWGLSVESWKLTLEPCGPILVVALKLFDAMFVLFVSLFCSPSILYFFLCHAYLIRFFLFKCKIKLLFYDILSDFL